MCDLSRENVHKRVKRTAVERVRNGPRSRLKRMKPNGWTADNLFRTDWYDGWTASEKFRTDGNHVWTAKKIFER